MPLHHGTSKAVFSHNISEMMHAGHKQDQALAAAYRMKRQGRDEGGSVGMIAGDYGYFKGLPQIDAVPLIQPTLPPQEELLKGPFDPIIGPETPVPKNPSGKLVSASDYPKRQGRDTGGAANHALSVAYRTKRADGGVAPWILRNEARSMARPMRQTSGMTHTGPVPSIVPGRTDRHNVNVASGSYVLPADHVSSLGQGNTAAGYAILNRMFSGGPYGGKALGVKHGAGAPRPPRMQRPFGSDEGGSRGEEHGSPTPVVIAGGEYVIPPHVVEAIGAGIAAEEGGTPLQRGHEALDEWVVQHRKKHVKTLSKLPPPAKR